MKKVLVFTMEGNADGEAALAFFQARGVALDVRDVGKDISLTILSGNLCGLLAPIVTGYVVAGMNSYDWALWIAGILLVIGAVAVGTMTRSVILSADMPGLAGNS